MLVDPREIFPNILNNFFSNYNDTLLGIIIPSIYLDYEGSDIVKLHTFNSMVYHDFLVFDSSSPVDFCIDKLRVIDHVKIKETGLDVLNVNIKKNGDAIKFKAEIVVHLLSLDLRNVTVRDQIDIIASMIAVRSIMVIQLAQFINILEKYGKAGGFILRQDLWNYCTDPNNFLEDIDNLNARFHYGIIGSYEEYEENSNFIFDKLMMSFRNDPVYLMRSNLLRKLNTFEDLFPKSKENYYNSLTQEQLDHRVEQTIDTVKYFIKQSVEKELGVTKSTAPINFSIINFVNDIINKEEYYNGKQFR